jgi:hypothetical protein
MVKLIKAKQSTMIKIHLEVSGHGWVVGHESNGSGDGSISHFMWPDLGKEMNTKLIEMISLVSSWAGKVVATVLFSVVIVYLFRSLFHFMTN